METSTGEMSESSTHTASLGHPSTYLPASAQITTPRCARGASARRTQSRTGGPPQHQGFGKHPSWLRVTLRNPDLAHGTNVKPHLTVRRVLVPSFQACKQHCQIQVSHTPLQVLKIPSRLVLEGAFARGISSPQTLPPIQGSGSLGNSNNLQIPEL